MAIEINHYVVLGLLDCGGVSVSEQEINRAYRLKARELHPDKKLNDPNAHVNFLRLQASYQVLKDEESRKSFDHHLRFQLQAKRGKPQDSQDSDSKRRKMASDLKERERSAERAKAHFEEEERIRKKLEEEIAAIRAMHARKTAAAFAAAFASTTPPKKEEDSISMRAGLLDKEKIVKVSWGKIGGGEEDYYTEQRIREIFEEFGGVEDIVIKSAKKKKGFGGGGDGGVEEDTAFKSATKKKRPAKKRRLALLVMASKAAAVAAVTVNDHVLGDVSNPLLVLPLQSTEQDGQFQAFEDSVLEKMKRAAQTGQTL